MCMAAAKAAGVLSGKGCSCSSLHTHGKIVAEGKPFGAAGQGLSVQMAEVPVSRAEACVEQWH